VAGITSISEMTVICSEFGCNPAIRAITTRYFSEVIKKKGQGRVGGEGRGRGGGRSLAN
jgi:hypothetical protein